VATGARWTNRIRSIHFLRRFLRLVKRSQSGGMAYFGKDQLDRVYFPLSTTLEGSMLSTARLVVGIDSTRLDSSTAQNVMTKSIILLNLSRARKLLQFKQTQKQLVQNLHLAIAENDLHLSLEFYKELSFSGIDIPVEMKRSVSVDCLDCALPFIQTSVKRRCEDAVKRDDISAVLNLVKSLEQIGLFDLVKSCADEVLCKHLSDTFDDAFAETCLTLTTADMHVNISALNMLYRKLNNFVVSVDNHTDFGKISAFQATIAAVFSTWIQIVEGFLLWFKTRITALDVDESTLSPAQIDAAIEDIIIVDRVCKAQLSLFSKRQSYAYNFKSGTYAELSQNCFEIFQHLAFLSDYCVHFENIYLRMSLRLSQVHKPTSVPSRALEVDDIFFLIDRSIRRVFGLTSAQTISKLISHILVILRYFADNGFSPAVHFTPELTTNLFQKIAEGSLQNAESGSGLSRDNLAKHTVASLNDVFLQLTYTDILSSRLNQMLLDVELLTNSIFSSRDDRAKVMDVVHNLEQLSNEAQRRCDSFIAGLVRARLHSIAPVFEQISSSNYVLSDEIYREPDELQPWVQGVLMFILKDFSAVFTVLSNRNVQLYVRHISEGLSTRLENIVQTRLSFNHLGSLKFERELRQLISGISSTTHFHVRDSFARIVQMCVLLSAETLNEVENYLVDMRRQSSWKLSESDVSKIILLRVDFVKS